MAQRGTKRKYHQYLKDSARKRARQAHRRVYWQTKVYIGSHKVRWDRMKAAENLQSDAEVADKLLACYSRFKQKLLGWSTPKASGLPQTPGLSPVRDSYSQGSETETAHSILGSTTDTAVSGVVSINVSPERTLPYVAKSSEMDESPHAAGISSTDSDPFGLDLAAQQDRSYQPDWSQLRYGVNSETDSDDESKGSSSSSDDLEKTGLDEYITSIQHSTSDEEEDKQSDSDDDDTLYTTCSGINMVTSAKDAVSDSCCIAYINCIATLAAHAPGDSCGVKNCGKPLMLSNEHKGTALYLTWKCESGHVDYKWCSQPRLRKRGVPAGDFLLSTNIILSGNNYTKIALLMKFMKLGCPTESLHLAVENLYTCESVDDYWSKLKVTTWEKMRGKETILAGDGRNDSPGHCAQYCTYTLMEHELKDIIEISIVDKRQVDLKSPNMENYGMKKALDSVAAGGLTIKELVTDAHRQIGSTMKKDYPDIVHAWDIWHGAKNLGKKLHAVAANKSCKILGPWVKDIQNHFWFCAQNCEGSVDKFTNMWRGILHHMVNRHQWSTGECHHEALSDDRNKEWLKPDSDAHSKLRDIIMDKTFLNNIKYYVNFRHTGTLESYHSHILMYAAKRFSFSFFGYTARSKLAAIDYQSHKDRAQKKTKAGVDRYTRTFNKRSRKWSVIPVKEAKQYSYIPDIQEDIVRRCLEDPLPVRRKVPLRPEDPRRIKKHIAPVSPPKTSEIREKQKSRYSLPQRDDSSSDENTILYWP